MTSTVVSSLLSTISSPSFSCPSLKARNFLLAFLLLLAFFLLLISAFSAVLLSGPFSASSIFSPRSRRAFFRFWDRERVAWHLTTMPVVRCFSWTAEDVLFYIAQLVSLSKLLGSSGMDDGRSSGLPVHCLSEKPLRCRSPLRPCAVETEPLSL